MDRRSPATWPALLTTILFKTNHVVMSIKIIRSPRAASAILTHPMRPRILALAREPMSASQLARQLGQPRQRVNYHVRQLADAGLLEASGQVKKRNMVEQQYVATAASYVLTPDLLGEAGPRVDEVEDAASAAHLVTLCARAQSEVAAVMESANAAGVRIRTTSLNADLYFENLQRRTEFTNALTQAVDEVIAKHTSTTGRPFRLILGCYPRLLNGSMNE